MASASQPPPGSTGGAPRTPPAPSAPAVPHVSSVQRCVVLVDWWLERVEGKEGKIRVAGIAHTPQMRKGASSSKGNRKVAGRVFRSAAIARRHNDTTIETEDGYLIQIGHLLNIPQTRENGFPEEVCEWFEFGFPIQWHKLVNPNMEQESEQQAQSPSGSAANAPSHSVEYYMKKFLSDSFTYSMRYAFTEDDQESDQHKSTQVDASEQEKVNRSISSVSVMQSAGSICPNTKVDGSILAPSKVVTVEKEGYRSRVGCCRAEEDADIPHENMQSCSSEQERVPLPIDSAIVNERMNSTSSDLREPATPNCGKASVNLGTTDALELPTERMTPQFGAVRGSEDSTVRRLRSGRVFGTPSDGTMKRGHKQKKIQHEASSKNMVHNKGGTSTADLTSHENDCSASGIVAEDKQELHDSHSKRREISAKKAKKRKESTKLFWNWL